VGLPLFLLSVTGGALPLPARGLSYGPTSDLEPVAVDIAREPGCPLWDFGRLGSCVPFRSVRRILMVLTSHDWFLA
jgi:hypothetical protein